MLDTGPKGSRLKIGVAGGSEAQRAGVRAALGEVTDLGIQFIDLVPGPANRNGGEGEEIQVVMTLLGDDRATWKAQLEPWRADKHTVVLALLSSRGADAVRAAIRAGAHEVLLLPLDQGDLTRSLIKISESHPVSGGHELRTYAFTSVSGGVGVSSLAFNLALAIHRLDKKKVALMDLDLQGGSLAVLMDMEAEHTISELADPSSPVDSIRLESILCKHESGLYLLAAPKRIEEAEMVSASVVSSILSVMREMFDFVLVDSSHHVSETSLAAWEQSQHLFYVIDQSVTAIRAAQRFLDLFTRLNLKEVDVSLLLNRFTPEHAITVEEIETALKRPLLAKIPRDDRAFTDAQIAGKGLSEVAFGGQPRASIEALARTICGIRPAAEDGSIMSKLLSAVRLGGE